MVVTRIKLPLEQREYSALLKLSKAQLRSPDDQARYILRQELERCGLLQSMDRRIIQQEENGET
jgi:uncharacterized protein (UPF0216 family)